MQDFSGFGDRLKNSIKNSAYTQKQISDMLHINQDTMTNYVKGTIPKADVLYKISQLLGISMGWLLTGEKETPTHTEDSPVQLSQVLLDEEQIQLEIFVDFLKYRRTWIETKQKERPPSEKSKKKPPGTEPAAQIREENAIYLPVLGESAAGQPIFINEILEGFVPVDKTLVHDKSFIVRAKGDSMTGRGINDGDLAVIRCQPAVEPGEPALVRIGDESIIKYFHQQDDHVVLMSDNPNYKPIIIRPPENITVVGKVIHVIKKEEGEAKLRDSQ